MLNIFRDNIMTTAFDICANVTTHTYNTHIQFNGINFINLNVSCCSFSQRYGCWISLLIFILTEKKCWTKRRCDDHRQRALDSLSTLRRRPAVECHSIWLVPVLWVSLVLIICRTLSMWTIIGISFNIIGKLFSYIFIIYKDEWNRIKHILKIMYFQFWHTNASDTRCAKTNSSGGRQIEDRWDAEKIDKMVYCHRFQCLWNWLVRYICPPSHRRSE